MKRPVTWSMPRRMPRYYDGRFHCSGRRRRRVSRMPEQIRLAPCSTRPRSETVRSHRGAGRRSEPGRVRPARRPRRNRGWWARRKAGMRVFPARSLRSFRRRGLPPARRQPPAVSATLTRGRRGTNDNMRKVPANRAPFTAAQRKAGRAGSARSGERPGARRQLRWIMPAWVDQ